MGRSQRDKGARAEREIAAISKEHGIAARRGQVFNGEDDIVTDYDDLIHIEVKRQETIKLGDWWKQTKERAGDRIALLFHRRSHEKWKVTMELEDFLPMLRLWLEAKSNDR